MVIHVHICIVQVPMVGEHNVGQPMEAIGVMDRVGYINFTKSSPLVGISGGGSTISVSLVYINEFI
jgi:hypothetical protein